MLILIKLCLYRSRDHIRPVDYIIQSCYIFESELIMNVRQKQSMHKN